MEPVLLWGSGVAIFVVASLLRLRFLGLLRARRTVAASAIAGLVVVLLSSVASATHTDVTTGTYTFSPLPWNGYKVFLSAPTHGDSGSRGECGWEENINGHHWSYYAASVNTGDLGSFYDRRYNVAVSNNPRTETEYVNHVAYANSWGADVYIITHTNAIVGCGNGASYLLTMYRSTVPNSVGLANELLADLSPVTPGGTNTWACDTLYECLNANAIHLAYVELFFHTNPSAVNWFQGDGLEGHGGVTQSWRYGYAVDRRLSYPR